MTFIVRRPGPPLDRLVRAITYQGGEQLRTSVEKILPSPGTSEPGPGSRLIRGTRIFHYLWTR